MVIGALKGWVGVRRGAEGGKKTWGYSRWRVDILPMQTGKGMGTTSVQCRSTDPPGEVMLASSFPSVIPPSSIKGGKKPGSSRVSFALRKILIHPRIQERATRISKRDRYWLFQAVYRRGGGLEPPLLSARMQHIWQRMDRNQRCHWVLA